MNPELEREVRRTAAFRCEYCHLPEQFSRLSFSLDHIIARQHGGANDPANLALCCGYCNRHKGPNIAGVDSATSQVTRLFHPRNDSWEEHFQWNGAVLIGRTPVGRTTIDVLAVNDRVPLSIRLALMNEGVFE